MLTAVIVSTFVIRRIARLIQEMTTVSQRIANGHYDELEAARNESEQVLDKLEAGVIRLRQQADTAAAKAEAAINDEKSARAYLSTRQEALDRAATLEERINALRQDLQRIDDLRDELATREAELKALEANEQLAELEASIREDLVYGR